ncbi:MAG: hypothetical protein AAFW74_16715, partial [Pseudomonadota bacterium]
KALTYAFLLPGTFVLGCMGIGVEEDAGMFRSFINSSFWGAIALWIALAFFAFRRVFSFKPGGRGLFCP